jgi:hypothetical protein
MTPQPDPSTVRAVLNKHDNFDRPSACETCVLADQLRHITTLAQRWAGTVEPNKNYSGRWIAHMVTSVLNQPE